MGLQNQYKKAGKLNDDSKYDESYPWYQDYDKSIGFRYKTKAGREYWFPLVGNIDPTKGTLQSVGRKRAVQHSFRQFQHCVL